MATTDKPWRREGDNSWGEFIDEINNILQEPPEDTDCEPIEPIVAPDPCHRWSKSDIKEVHDRLNQMPGDCFSFQEIPDKWNINIIEDIEDQLENAWCDCEADDECLQPCSNAGSNQTIFLGEITVTGDDCRNGDETGPGDTSLCIDPYNDFLDERNNTYFPVKNEYNEKYVEVCELEAELEELQDDLEKLQDQLAQLEEAKDQACEADPDGQQCQTLMEQVEDKQDEISDKQEEIETTQAALDQATEERDTAKDNYIESGQRLLELHKDNVAYYDDQTPCITLIEGMSFPPPVAPCSELPAECHFIQRFPTRCEVEWRLQRRCQTTRFACNGAGPFGGKFTRWKTVAAGEWDVDGNLVPLSIGSSGSKCGCALLQHFCVSFGANPCKGFAGCANSPCACPGCERVCEYRVILDFPNTFTPFNCDGDPGPCTEGDGGGPEPPPG